MNNSACVPEKNSVSESLVLRKVKVKSLKLVSRVSATGKSKTTKREIINLTGYKTQSFHSTPLSR